jgi:YbgC/YbaW family acyl-CoA thioester hydrolase
MSDPIGQLRSRSEHRVRRRVAFSETDMAGIVHFSIYPRYMEDCEHEFLRSLSLGVDAPLEKGRLGFPRLAIRCEYRRPLRFEDELDVELRVCRIGRSSVTYQFLLASGGDEVARGEMTASACRCHPDGRMEPIELPPVFRERVKVSTLEPLEFKPGRTRAVESEQPVPRSRT